MTRPGKFTPSFRLGPWLVRPDLNRVENAETGAPPVQIEPRVMAVLLCLTEEPGQVVTRLDLLDRVWGDSVVGEEILTRAVSELRRVFGDSARQPCFIETIRNHGYRVIAPVEAVETEVLETLEAPAVPAGPGAAPGPAPTTAPAPAPEPAPEAEAEDPVPEPSEPLAPAGPRPEPSPPEFADPDFPVLGTVSPRRVRWRVFGPGLAVLAVAVAMILSFPRSQGPEVARQAPPRLRALPLTSYPGRERHPALSPDGTRVAFVRSEPGVAGSHLFLKQRESEATLQLSEGPGWAAWPAWSPDGQNLAFVHGDDEGPAICRVSSLGGPLRVLWRGPHLVEGLDWSPRGDVLVFATLDEASGRLDLFSLDLADLTVQPLAPPPPGLAGELHPVFDPRGARLAWVGLMADGSMGLLVGDTAGGQPEVVAEGLAEVRGLAWAADGGSLVYAASPGGNFSLWQVDLTGSQRGHSHWLSTEGDGAWNPTIARRTGELAYEDVRVDQDLWQVKVLAQDPYQLETSVFLQSTRWEYAGAFSPDGGQVALVSARSGYPEIWLADAQGQDLQRLTDLQGPGLTDLCWSPDGSQLAFTAVRQGRRVILVLAANGGAPRQVTPEGEQEIRPSWSRDGKELLFAARRQGRWEISRRPVAGGPRVAVTTAGGTSGRLSPDGRRLFHTRPGEAGLWVVELEEGRATGQPTLILADLSVRDQACWALAAGPAPAEGAPEVDGGQILWVRRSGNAAILARHDLATGETSYLTTLPGFAASELGVSPAGHTILFARTGSLTGDLMIVSRWNGKI